MARDAQTAQIIQAKAQIWPLLNRFHVDGLVGPAHSGLVPNSLRIGDAVEAPSVAPQPTVVIASSLACIAMAILRLPVLLAIARAIAVLATAGDATRYGDSRHSQLSADRLIVCQSGRIIRSFRIQIAAIQIAAAASFPSIAAAKRI
jgi:hypothetical protein